MGFALLDKYMVRGEDVDHWCPSCGKKIVPMDPGDRQGWWEHESEVAADLCDELAEMDSPVCHIEFILCYQDQTWETEIVEVPPILHHEDCTDGDRVEWYGKVHGYGPAVHVGVFHLAPYE